MIIINKIRDEKLQYDINRKAAKMSAVSLGKIDKYEYLAGEKRLLSDQSRMIKQAKEKQRNTTKEQGKKANRSFRSYKTRRKLRTKVN